MQELERGDSGVRSTASVQGIVGDVFLFMPMAAKHTAISIYPNWQSGEWLGCFGLTEPTMAATLIYAYQFKDAGDHVLLNGSKMWISNAPFAQVAVVWARNEQNEIQGLIVERHEWKVLPPTTWQMEPACKCHRRAGV